MSKACFFDLDGTLIPNPSSEVRFLKILFKKLQISPSGVVIWFLESLFKYKNFKNSKAYYHGLKAEHIYKVLKSSQNKIIKAISQKAIDHIEQKRKEGYRLFLITGAPDFIAQVVSDYLKLEGFYASFLEIRNGKYTGKIKGKIPFGKNKEFILKEIARREGIELKNSITYADHHKDIHFLEASGIFFAVNPTKKLRKIVPQNQILIWD
uniref:HAD-IB family hydrolase n=1 Tax=candidate division WOR-3 bacterium TaxID=2052148 RepID=A0A7V4E6F4_UNCW3